MSPIPSRIGPTLNRSRSTAPEMATSAPGPRTLDTTRLNGGGWCEAAPRGSRAALPHCGAGGANCTQSTSMSGPSVRCTILDSFVTAEMAFSRSSGSSMSVARVVNRLDTLLPPRRGAARWVGGHGDTGHQRPHRELVVGQQPAAYGAADTASTTSFMVTPLARWTSLIAATLSVQVAKLRRAVRDRLKRVRGASRIGRGTPTVEVRDAARARPRPRRSARAAPAGSRSAGRHPPGPS